MLSFSYTRIFIYRDLHLKEIDILFKMAEIIRMAPFQVLQGSNRSQNDVEFIKTLQYLVTFLF